MGVVIFVKSVQRAIQLDKLLQECNFPSVAIHARIEQAERIELYQSFKDFKHRILVSTDIWGRGIDIEHPSEVQHECIPQAILGMDVICQAKSGMGKTAVFVLSSLHQLEAKEGQVGAIVLCHTRELAFQINNEFERFGRYLPDVKVKVFYGGVPVPEHKRILKSECPHIIVGTPGRILQLVREKDLVTKNVKHFILDECDKMLEKLDMR